MQIHSPVRLGAIAYALGRLTPIDSLQGLVRDRDLLALYRRRGFAQYARAQRPEAEELQAVCQTTLRAAEVDPSTVEAIIVCSDTCWSAPGYRPRALAQLFVSLGVCRAQLLTQARADCNNLGQALCLAAALVTGQGLRHVLVVTQDRVPRNYSVDDDPTDLTILSDAAASCLVSREVGAFAITSAAQASDMGLLTLNISDELKTFAQRTRRGIATASGEALDRAQIAAAAVKTLLTNNYAKPVQKTIQDSAGISSSAHYFDNIARFGHAFAADLLINLADAAASERIRGGAPCLLLGSAASSWSALLLDPAC